MSKFTFQIEDEEDGTITTVEFNSETWIDAFPKFLDACRGAGFNISHEAALYSPTASEYMFGDRDFLIFDTDLVRFVPNGKEPISEDGIEHTEAYYDTISNY
jgi:hypothetical protein